MKIVPILFAVALVCLTAFGDSFPVLPVRENYWTTTTEGTVSNTIANIALAAAQTNLFATTNAYVATNEVRSVAITNAANSLAGLSANFDSENTVTNIFGGKVAIVGGTVLEGSGNVILGGGIYDHAEGYQNTVGGQFSHVEGQGNKSTGDQSFAGGNNAYATNNNSFVWSDGAILGSVTNNTFSIKAANGIRLLGGSIQGNGGGLTNLQTIISGVSLTNSDLFSNVWLDPFPSILYTTNYVGIYAAGLQITKGTYVRLSGTIWTNVLGNGSAIVYMNPTYFLQTNNVSVYSSSSLLPNSVWVNVIGSTSVPTNSGNGRIFDHTGILDTNVFANGIFAGDGSGLAGVSATVTTASITNAAGVITNMVLQNAQLRVDKTGSDSTGARGSFATPFLTITNALTKSQYGDSIKVGGGSYTNTGLLASNGVSYFFDVNATLSSDLVNLTGCFDDYARATTNNVFGYGRFNARIDPNLIVNTGYFNITNPATVLNVFGSDFYMLIPSDGQAGFGISNYKATCNYTFGTVEVFDPALAIGPGQGGGFLNYDSGNVNVTFDTLVTDNLAAFQSTDRDTDIFRTGVLTVHGKYLHATGGGIPLFWYGGGSDNGRNLQEFFYIDDIEANTASAISDVVGGGGKFYVPNSSKISNHSSTKATIDFDGGAALATNRFWLNSQKVQNDNSGGLYRVGPAAFNSTNQSEMYLSALQWQCTGTAYTTGFQIYSGTHTFYPGTLVLTNGCGLLMTNGRVTMNNFIIDTSATGTASNNPIIIRGGSLTLNGGQLISASGVLGIQATNAVTVQINGTDIPGGISSFVTVVGTWTSNGVIRASSGFSGNGSALTNIPTTGINWTTNVAPLNATTPVLWITNAQYGGLIPLYK